MAAIEADEDGSVRIGADGPRLTLALPRHAIGADGSDAFSWQARTTVDPDEVETVCVAGALRATIRHEIGLETWRVRVALDNTSDETLSLSRGLLEVDRGRGTAWVWAARSAGLLVLALDPSDPIWALALKQGLLTRDADQVVWIEDGTQLAASGRLVMELSGRRMSDWTQVGSLLPSWLPPLAVRGGEPIEFALPDAGFVGPDCAIGEGSASTEIHGEGVRSVSVRGVFGELDLELAFAPRLEEAVGAAARQIARLVTQVPGAVHQLTDTGPAARSRGLERTARRLIVLQAAHSDAAADIVRGVLLDGVTDLLQSGGVPGPFALAALAGELQRRDDPQALRALLDAFGEVEAEPGMLVALTRVWAVLWGLGHDPEPVRQTLAWVMAQPGGGRLVEIERAIVGGAPDGPVRLLAVLGGGLPGDPLPAPEPWERAYAAALVSLVPDDHSERQHLVQAAEATARRVTARDPGDADVLAWLLLGE